MAADISPNIFDLADSAPKSILDLAVFPIKILDVVSRKIAVFVTKKALFSTQIWT